MLAGLPYNCGDPDLIERWHRAKALTTQYNQCDTRDRQTMERLLDELLGARGKGAWIAPPLHVDYGEQIFLGENAELNMNCVILDCNEVRIGRNAMIGPAVQIYAVGHPVDVAERQPPAEGGAMAFCLGTTGPVTIGDNVWIGGGSIILPGVTIGEGTTIGAGSVVTRDIPPNVLALGNPCRIIRKINNATL